MQTRDYLERMIRQIAEALAGAARASAAGRHDEAEKVLEGAFSGALGIPRKDLARLDDTTLLALLGPGKLGHVASLLEAEADIAQARGELVRADKLRHRVRSLRGLAGGP